MVSKDVSRSLAPEPDYLMFIPRTEGSVFHHLALKLTDIRPGPGDPHHRTPLVSALAAARSLSRRARIASALSFQVCSIR